MRISIPTVAGFAVLALICIPAAFAQVPRYVPPGGNPIPTQLDYFRRDVGPLDPYNQFVRPRRELTQRLREMETREQTDYRATGQAIQQIRKSSAAATGTGSTFMNYSHYYKTPTVNVRRQR